MPQPIASASPLPSRHFHLNILSADTAKSSFTLRVAPGIGMGLTFRPRSIPPRPTKRCRTVADIDGEHSCIHKKKRRLRLFLITSRLSPQYSHPATNIVDRGSSKIAVWAKQKAAGRNLLCKAAILNCIRRRAIGATEIEGNLEKVLVEQEREQEQLRLADFTLNHGSHDFFIRPGRPPPPSLSADGNSAERHPLSPSSSPSSSGSPSPPLRPFDYDGPSEYRSPNDAYFDSSSRSRIPHRSYIPLPPSPLGLSNYDAFDQEDDIPDPYTSLDDEYEFGDRYSHQEEGSSCPFVPSSSPYQSTTWRINNEGLTSPEQKTYSDFGFLDPDEPLFGDYDQVDEGADAIWPSKIAPRVDAVAASPLSSSPDFPTLFATSQTSSIHLSPNLIPLTATAVSPNFSSPPLAPTLSPVSMYPNVPCLPAISNETRITTEQAELHFHGLDLLHHKGNSELEEERRRQKRITFMQFGS